MENKWIAVWALLVLLSTVILSFSRNGTLFLLMQNILCGKFLAILSWGHQWIIIPINGSQQPARQSAAEQVSLQYKVLPSAIRTSSLWCNNDKLEATNDGEWQCRIESLCLRLASQEYIFVYDQQESTFLPAELRQWQQQRIYGRLSSVFGHNRYDLNQLVTVPRKHFTSLSDSFFYVRGRTIIMSRFKPDNLMHLLHDDILPLFDTIRKFSFDIYQNQVFLDDHWPPNMGSIFFDSLFPRMLHQSFFPQDSIVCFEDAHIGLSNNTVWYQYGFLQPQGAVPRSPDEKIYIANSIKLFRKRVIEAFDLDDSCPTIYSLLLLRMENRRILNGAELFNFLLVRLPNLQLVSLHRSIFDDAHKLRELLQFAICARTLIGMHGSELALAILMQSVHSNPATVIEMFPYGLESTYYTPYRTLAALMGHRYHSWTNNLRQNAVFPSDDYPAEHGGLSHIDSKVRQSIEQSVDKILLPHLCCNDPNWLYRIYQDTKVDIDSFAQSLNNYAQNSKYPDNTLHHSNRVEYAWLAEVSELSCQVNKNQSNYVIIHWKPPWNVFFYVENNDFNIKLEYQILIQFNSKKTILLQTKHQTLSVDKLDCIQFVCNVWVKPYQAALHKSVKLLGSFTRQPVTCS